MKAVVAAFVDRKQNKRERGGPAEIAYYRRKERERSLCVSVRVLFNIRSSKQVGRRAPSWFEKKYAFFYSSRRLDRSIRTHTQHRSLFAVLCMYTHTCRLSPVACDYNVPSSSANWLMSISRMKLSARCGVFFLLIFSIKQQQQQLGVKCVGM